jgi:hypothetical protein
MRRTLAIGVALAAVGAGASPAAARENPYFPLTPGTQWVYEGHDEGVHARDVVTVTDRTRRVAGVRTTVVNDRVFMAGRLREHTSDYYAADRHGTVRYYGERTATLKADGSLDSREGSWLAGTDGARAGVFMPAHPRVGQAFRQEFYADHAEDHFRVLSRHASIDVPFGSFDRNALMTKEWTPLEPGVRDRKWYVRGIGQVAEATVRGGSERFELVAFHRG